MWLLIKKWPRIPRWQRELKQARGPSNNSTFHTDMHSLDLWQERQPWPSREPIRSCLPSPPPPPFPSGAAWRLAFSPPSWQEARSSSSSWASYWVSTVSGDDSEATRNGARDWGFRSWLLASPLSIMVSNFMSLSWTGRPGVLRFMGPQRVGHDGATEVNWTELSLLERSSGKRQEWLSWRKDGVGANEGDDAWIHPLLTAYCFSSVRFCASPLGDSWSLLSIPYLFIHSGRIWEVDRCKVGKEGQRHPRREITFAEIPWLEESGAQGGRVGVQTGPDSLPPPPHCLLSLEKLHWR